MRNYLSRRNPVLSRNLTHPRRQKSSYHSGKQNNGTTTSTAQDYSFPQIVMRNGALEKLTN